MLACQHFSARAQGLRGAVWVQGVWSRALGLPIERPKSVTMGTVEAKFK